LFPGLLVFTIGLADNPLSHLESSEMLDVLQNLLELVSYTPEPRNICDGMEDEAEDREWIKSEWQVVVPSSFLSTWLIDN